jgi:hypothetical protein
MVTVMDAGTRSLLGLDRVPELTSKGPGAMALQVMLRSPSLPASTCQTTGGVDVEYQSCACVGKGSNIGVSISLLLERFDRGWGTGVTAPPS